MPLPICPAPTTWIFSTPNGRSSPSRTQHARFWSRSVAGAIKARLQAPLVNGVNLGDVEVLGLGREVESNEGVEREQDHEGGDQPRRTSQSLKQGGGDHQVRAASQGRAQLPSGWISRVEQQEVREGKGRREHDAKDIYRTAADAVRKRSIDGLQQDHDDPVHDDPRERRAAGQAELGGYVRDGERRVEVGEGGVADVGANTDQEVARILRKRILYRLSH